MIRSLSWWFGIRQLCTKFPTVAKLQFTREVVKLDMEQLYTKRVSWEHMRLINLSVKHGETRFKSKGTSASYQ